MDKYFKSVYIILIVIKIGYELSTVVDAVSILCQLPEIHSLIQRKV